MWSISFFRIMMLTFVFLCCISGWPPIRFWTFLAADDSDISELSDDDDEDYNGSSSHQMKLSLLNPFMNQMHKMQVQKAILPICHGELYDHWVNSYQFQISKKEQGKSGHQDKSLKNKKNLRRKKEDPSNI